MSDLKVVKFDKIKETDHFKDEMLRIIDDIRSQIESGLITEFVSTSVTDSGEIQIHTATKDFLGGIGLYDYGKSLFIDENR